MLSTATNDLTERTSYIYNILYTSESLFSTKRTALVSRSDANIDGPSDLHNSVFRGSIALSPTMYVIATFTFTCQWKARKCNQGSTLCQISHTSGSSLAS